MFDSYRSERGSNPGAVNFHNAFHYTIVRHHWQVSENDYFSKWSEAKALKDKSATSVACFFI